MKFSDIVQRLGLTAENSSLKTFPECDPEITAVTPVQTGTVGTIGYIEGQKFQAYVATTQVSALILPEDQDLQTRASDRGLAWVSMAEPRWGFAQALALFYQPYRPRPGIHPTAVIDQSGQLGKDVTIDANVVIHPGVVIGDGVCIHANVVIYPETVIGDRTVLYANCVIHEHTHIGADCVVHSGAVIGSEGFGFILQEGRWIKIPQSGRTILEAEVEVGCNTTIDRPSVGETRIQANTKLDNLVHIAHNCQIGPSCVMAAQVGLAGQVETQDHVILGGQVGAANQTHIGANVQAGAKAGLHGHIAPGSIVMGNPASPYRTFLKSSAIYNRLPQMQRTLKELQQQVATLQQQIEALNS
ncbi:UDP-3-O-(3-hydroxymyristoyl)glucosamine N-acyltransferase [Halomicronema sp. CCY15110]|uniref:UDP-3-O-(3-hydroxymyristoyl)glucosamine N-acyltransferase n=1 Tax=Halomicronema sp. CCY15110 TaxID=2767773 RepID=UPI0019529FCC|nr:UDP-3-O-(3-hydroxymyristoyl)glucosamine N-acyltransferase [Halomicronema sp. CCY15110]